MSFKSFEVIKTDCEYYEMERAGECYMFKTYNCKNCKQYRSNKNYMADILKKYGRNK